MDQIETDIEDRDSKPKAKQRKCSTVPIRIKKQTAKEVKLTLQKANKKNIGRRLKADDLISKLLTLLEDKHIEEIIQATLSNSDRLELSYQKYCKQNKQITKDEYLGMLLKDSNNYSVNKE